MAGLLRVGLPVGLKLARQRLQDHAGQLPLACRHSPQVTEDAGLGFVLGEIMDVRGELEFLAVRKCGTPSGRQQLETHPY
jgi:hypothetical protein